MASVARLRGAPALLLLLLWLPEPATAEGPARPSGLAARAPALPRARHPCATRVGCLARKGLRFGLLRRPLSVAL
eukprot:10932241-Alexandrium_andersonii.AAC.1